MIKEIMLLLIILCNVNSVSAIDDFTNGGFETGNMDGWVINTPDGAYASATGPIAGTYSCWMSPATPIPEIYQIINLTGVGSFSFQYRIEADRAFSVYVDSVEKFNVVGTDPITTYTKEILTPETGNTEIKIALKNPVSGKAYLLDSFFTCIEPSYISLNFKDNCGNLIEKTAGTYYNSGDPLPLNFYTSTGTYDILFEDQDYIELWVDSAIGTLYYNISNPSADIGYTILNPTISWNNNIMVVNGTTLNPISGALVSFFQDCIIDSSVYPSRNKFTDSNGVVNFKQCELDSFSLGVSADGYKSYSGSISSSAMDAFCLSQTVVIKLYPESDEVNETEFNYTDYNTNIYFKDVDGNYTTSILDTDNYVDLYYYNNNSDGGAMTLKFQKYSIETGIIDLLSWNIPIDTEGYKRILKSNYTDTSYLYIGYLYNYSIDGWDRTEYLNIRNETSEIDLDYQNLTAFVLFRNKNSEGSIDYREDIEIIAYANTTYVGLFNISLELYDNSSFITHVNLTWADFIGADIEYYYEWNPSHSYINGHNYTVRTHGYDYYLLDMDYVNATDYRKNKLTIIVKDRSGANLNNSFVFLEGYGSLPTHDSYYNSYEDLINGNYRYKASKSGYSDTGWDHITLADGDATVTYILTSDTANTTYLPQKTSDEDIQAIFFPLMFALLIFILIGAFKYVCE